MVLAYLSERVWVGVKAVIANTLKEELTNLQTKNWVEKEEEEARNESLVK